MRYDSGSEMNGKVNCTMNGSINGTINGTITEVQTKNDSSDVKLLLSERKYNIEIVWRNIFKMIILHTSAIYGLYLFLFVVQYKTVCFTYACAIFSGMGVTAGAHRLWTHRSYKAKLPLRVILMIFNSMALQNDIYEWSRDHRVHHKYSETDADPHNSNRGFFFSHIGWLMCKKHPDVHIKGNTVDMSDVWADPIVRFQRQFYYPLIGFWCFLLPAFLPYYYWNEDFMTAFFTCSMFRYCIILHMTWLVNSAAHLYGGHPYDKSLKPAENKLVVYASYGEGYHNYHHAFPYDYSTSELGWKNNFNFSTFFIDFFSVIGWAYDLRKAPRETVHKRIKRTGEATDVHYIKREGSTVIGGIFGLIWVIFIPIFMTFAIRGIFLILT